MMLLTAIEAYVMLKRSLGAVFAADTRILHSLGRRLGEIPLKSIASESCQAFCRGEGPPTRFWERKHSTLRGFFTFLVGRGHLAASPLQEPGPRVRITFRPYVYSHDEIRALLDATAILSSNRSPLQPLTFRTLLLLLYGTGLRPSEGLSLRSCDADLRDRLLSIWDSKFFKSRLVPIGTELCEALQRYRNERRKLPMPSGPRSAFFANQAGKAISLGRLEGVFARLREHAGIRRPVTDRWQPRLHDLRHAFAVHRLIAWYRQGEDVQACLPLLATYLGHINISGTQKYLSMTSELLVEASQRFERYASNRGERRHG